MNKKLILGMLLIASSPVKINSTIQGKAQIKKAAEGKDQVLKRYIQNITKQYHKAQKAFNKLPAVKAYNKAKQNFHNSPPAIAYIKAQQNFHNSPPAIAYIKAEQFFHRSEPINYIKAKQAILKAYHTAQQVFFRSTSVNAHSNIYTAYRKKFHNSAPAIAYYDAQTNLSNSMAFVEHYKAQQNFHNSESAIAYYDAQIAFSKLPISKAYYKAQQNFHNSAPVKAHIKAEQAFRRSVPVKAYRNWVKQIKLWNMRDLTRNNK